MGCQGKRFQRLTCWFAPEQFSGWCCYSKDWRKRDYSFKGGAFSQRGKGVFTLLYLISPLMTALCVDAICITFTQRDRLGSRNFPGTHN